MMLGSPSKPFLLKLSPIVAAVADFRLLLWENQQIPKLGQLGKSIRLANMPTVLNGGGGVCRFETPITSFFDIFCYWNLPTSENQLQNSPLKFCYLFWASWSFYHLPHFFGTKKNGLHLRGWTFGGEKFRENLPVALGPGHSSAGYLRFMTSITSFATSRCTETGKPAGCSWRKWRKWLERLGSSREFTQKKSLIQSRNGDATSFFLLEAPQKKKKTYCIGYVLQTKCRNESNTV